MNPQQPQQPYPPQTPPPSGRKPVSPWVWLGGIGAVLLLAFGGCTALGAALTDDKPAPARATTAANNSPKPLSEDTKKRIASKECRKALGMPDNAVFGDRETILVMTDGSRKVIVAGTVTSSGTRASWRCVIQVYDDFDVNVLEAGLR